MVGLRVALVAVLLLSAWSTCGDVAATPQAAATPAGNAAVAAGASAGAIRLQHANAHARVTRDGTRLSTTGPDLVAAAFAGRPLRGRAYVEAVLFHGGEHAVGVSLWGERPELLRNDAHPGRSYGAAGASAQAVSAWAVVAYANYGLPGEAKLELADLPGTPGQRIVVQLAVDAESRAVWMKLAGARGWAGGGDPAKGLRPTLVLGGAAPIRVGGNVSSPASYVELQAPARHAGAAPAGFTPFG